MKSRRNPSQKRSRFLVDTVIEAGREVLALPSAASIPISRIAERAGVSIGSIYQYFATKDEMLTEIKLRQADQHRTFFEEKVAELKDVPLEAALEKAIHAICDLYLKQPTLLRNLMRNGPEWRKLPFIQRAREAMSEKIVRHLETQAPGTLRKQNARLTVFILMNSVMGTLEAAVSAPEEQISPDELAELKVELLDLCKSFLLQKNNLS